MTVGSGCPLGPKGPKYTAQAAIASRIKPEKTTSFQHPVRHERHAVRMRQVVVLLQVVGPANQPARHRPLVDPQLQNHQHVQSHERDQQTGDHKYVQREETGERLRRR